MDNWTVTASCGGRFPAIDPVFFSDRSRVAVASALAIKIFQLNTKQMIAKIAIDCTDAVQLLLTRDETEFLIVRKSGTVEKIGLDETESVRLESDVKVKRMVNEKLALILNQRNQYEIGLITFGESAKFESLFESSLLTNDSGLVAVSQGDEYAVFMAPKSGKIELFNLINSKVTHLNAVNRSTATSLAVSDGGVVAIGNSSGVIDMLYPNHQKSGNHGNQRSVRTLKWHLEPVTALKFTANDEYLLSGGSERVLVFWQLSTNRQQFLPRLDGYISSISTNSNNSLYGLILDKSQLVVLSAVDLVSRLQVAGTRAEFVKLVPDHQAARRRRRKRQLDLWANTDYTAAMQIHPGTRQAYLLSGNASCQVFSLVRDDQEQVVKLARTLDAGKVRDELEIADPEVDLLKFSGNGKFMVTVDTTRTPKGLLSSQDSSINLKFWAQNNGKWVVVSRVESPHGAQVEIRDMVINDTNTVITAGSDGSLRLWRLVEDNSIAAAVNRNTSNSRAAAKSVNAKFVLKQISPSFGTQSPYVSLAWTADKSVLALAYETSIYLIDAKRLKVVKQLPNIAGAPVRGLAFAQSKLVVLDKTRLTVFDLVSYTLTWAIELKSPQHGARLLAVDPHSNRFALAVNYWTPQYRVNAKVVQMSTASPIPLNTYVHGYAVSAIDLIPGTKSYCFIDQRGVLSTLAGALQGEEASNQAAQQTSLVSLYMSQAPEEVDEELEGKAKNVDVNAVSKVFDANSNLEQLFDRVLTLVS